MKKVIGVSFLAAIFAITFPALANTSTKEKYRGKANKTRYKLPPIQTNSVEVGNSPTPCPVQQKGLHRQYNMQEKLNRDAARVTAALNPKMSEEVKPGKRVTGVR